MKMNTDMFFNGDAKGIMNSVINDKNFETINACMEFNVLTIHVVLRTDLLKNTLVLKIDINSIKDKTIFKLKNYIMVHGEMLTCNTVSYAKLDNYINDVVSFLYNKLNGIDLSHMVDVTDFMFEVIDKKKLKFNKDKITITEVVAKDDVLYFRIDSDTTTLYPVLKAYNDYVNKNLIYDVD